MARTGVVYQVNVSGGGVPKWPVPQAAVSEYGMEGDRQSDQMAHGGPQRALCLFALERIEELAAEGHDIAPGHLGENVTVSGIEWRLVLPGCRMRIGHDVLIEITDYTAPCFKQSQWFTDGDFNRINSALHLECSRVYAKVLESGVIAAGDTVELLQESVVERFERRRIPGFTWKPPAPR
ncbi:MAG: MOSC domain-containing protein [Dehalococcoidia bacterium]|nr:MOSC domain-containing protein [Dehalococcoidia bacterium]